jgi:hypothetical protein
MRLPQRCFTPLTLLCVSSLLSFRVVCRAPDSVTVSETDQQRPWGDFGALVAFSLPSDAEASDYYRVTSCPPSTEIILDSATRSTWAYGLRGGIGYSFRVDAVKAELQNGTLTNTSATIHCNSTASQFVCLDMEPSFPWVCGTEELACCVTPGFNGAFHSSMTTRCAADTLGFAIGQQCPDGPQLPICGTTDYVVSDGICIKCQDGFRVTSNRTGCELDSDYVPPPPPPPPEVPDAPSLSRLVEPPSLTSAVFQWQAGSDNRAPITHFLVQTSSSSSFDGAADLRADNITTALTSSSNLAVTKSGQIYSLTITQLRTGVRVYARVKAFNSVGGGGFTAAESSAYVVPSSVPLAPLNLNMSHSSSVSMLVELPHPTHPFSCADYSGLVSGLQVSQVFLIYEWAPSAASVLYLRVY